MYMGTVYLICYMNTVLVCMMLSINVVRSYIYSIMSFHFGVSISSLVHHLCYIITRISHRIMHVCHASQPLQALHRAVAAAAATSTQFLITAEHAIWFTSVIRGCERFTISTSPVIGGCPVAYCVYNHMVQLIDSSHVVYR